MTPAIEAGRQLGALDLGDLQAELFAYAFDTVAYPIQPKGTSLADWEKAMAGINAGGGTSCGVALDWMRRKGQRVEQIVMVTDEGENCRAAASRKPTPATRTILKVRPSVILVKIGQATNLLEQDCEELGVAPNVFEFRGDYYALPNIIPLLTYPSLSEMVMEVLAYPLPERGPSLPLKGGAARWEPSPAGSANTCAWPDNCRTWMNRLGPRQAWSTRAC